MKHKKTIFVIFWLLGSVVCYRTDKAYFTHRYPTWTQVDRCFAISISIITSWFGVVFINAVDWIDNNAEKQADW